VELKNNSKECVVECGTACTTNTDNDSSTQKEIRSHGNVDLEDKKLVGWIK